MKLNKTFGRIATTLVATAMLASVAVVPAFAAEPTQGAAGGENMLTIKIDKQLVMPADTTTPDNMTFYFAIENGEAGGTVNFGEGDSATTREVYAGVGATELTVGQVTIDDDDSSLTRNPTTNGNVYVEKELTLTLPLATAFDKAGVYKYKIVETNDFEGTDYIDHTDGLDLYLIVERTNAGTIGAEESYKITGAFVYPKGVVNNTGAKTADYINYYKLNNEGEKTVNSLAFTKQIAGAMGDKNDSFTFEVAVPGVADNTVYKYDRTGITANAKTDADVVAKDGKLTFTNVGHGETITVKGLDIGTSYVVTETDAGTYKVSTVADDSDGDLNDNKATLAIAADSIVSTTFTNTREAVSPTGLVMDIAPYALLVVVAAAGCFVFLRKRRED